MSEPNGSNHEDGNVSSCNADMGAASHGSAIIITQTAFYSLILLASLFGNALIIHIASRTARTTKNAATTNLLIANMATSDLLISIFAIPRKIIEIHIGQGKWLLSGLAGQISCKCIFFFQDISTAVSIQSLAVISLDRFVAVVFPYHRPLMGAWGCKFVVIPLIWIISMAIHSPYFYTFKIIENGLNQTHAVQCVSRWAPAFRNGRKTQEEYYIVLLVLVILLPLLILTILYCIIIFQLRVKNRKDHSTHDPQRLREDSKVIKKIIAIILVYILCLTPVNVYALLLYFVWDWETPCGAQGFVFASYFILFSNSAINPLLYFTFNERYRQELRNLLKKFHLFRSDDSTGEKRHTSVKMETAV